MRYRLLHRVVVPHRRRPASGGRLARSRNNVLGSRGRNFFLHWGTALLRWLFDSDVG